MYSYVFFLIIIHAKALQDSGDSSNTSTYNDSSMTLVSAMSSKGKVEIHMHNSASLF